MRNMTLLAVVALTGCRESTDYGPQIAALEETTASQQETIDALNAELDALEGQATEDSARITDLEEEILAINGLDLTDLLGDVEDLETRTATLEGAGHATEQWVLDKGYATDADLNAVSTSVAANTDQISQNSTFIASNSSSIVTNSAGINNNVLSIANNQVDIGANTSRLIVTEAATTANASAIATNAGDIATNAGAIATNAGDIATNAGDIASNAGDIASNAADIGTNAGDIASNAGDIATNAGDIAANAADIAATMDASLMGMYPAVFDYSNTSYEASYEHGRGGYLMVTSGGAYRLSGYMTASGVNRRWYVTFYVTNPTSSDVVIDWDYCGGDTTNVSVDGVYVATPPDRDGNCGLEAGIFTLTPGSHVITVRYLDGNNWFEGMGVANSWIIDNGLDIDWAAMNGALAAGL